MAALLEIDHVTKLYGGLAANADVSCHVRAGEIVSVIGPNGAGKTTLFNVVTGVERPQRGSVRFEGRDITGLEPEEIARLGLVRTFQQTKIFPEATVAEAVAIGRHLHDSTPLWSAALSTARARAARRESRAAVAGLLALLGMSNRSEAVARNLSYGDQKLLGIAIALAAQPRLLLLDEPAAGMNAQEAARVIEIIRTIQGTGVTVVLVEHNMRLVMNVSDRVLVLDHGELIAQGPPEQVRQSPQVIEAYLGRKARA